MSAVLSRSGPAAAALALLLAGTGCRITREVTHFPGTDSILLRTVPTRTYEVQVDGAERGRLVLQEAIGAPDRRYWSVRNRWDQELGMVDALGRAWRHVPHVPEPEWVATGSVAEGAGAILGTPHVPCLVERPAGSPERD
jgi:hypothetical protein